MADTRVLCGERHGIACFVMPCTFSTQNMLVCHDSATRLEKSKKPRRQNHDNVHNINLYYCNPFIFNTWHVYVLMHILYIIHRVYAHCAPVHAPFK